MKEAKANGALDDMEDSEENNAASIIVPVEFEDGTIEEWLFMFKNETHNHPTEIEPYGGAATCLGGAIRDPLSGRSYVMMGMRITGSGDPRSPLDETMEGKLPQRRISTVALAGNSAYGNQIGVPTLHVREFYHEGFCAKRLELGYVAGAVPYKQVVREEPLPGDVVIVIGRTGRDGIGGATGSSNAHTNESVELQGAEVQKGNPVEERKIQRFFRDPAVSAMIKRCNDFGAGGVCVAIGELANGIDVDLDAIPLKYLGLDGTEIAISESQERMAIVVTPEDAQAFLKAADMENIEATIVGNITDKEKLMMKWRGEIICDLDRPLLNGGWAERTAAVDMNVPEDVSDYFNALPADIGGSTLHEQWLSNLSRLNVSSQRAMQMRFDSTVGANSVTSPYGGVNQASPSEAAVVRFPAEGALTRMANAASFDPDLACLSPYHGAMYSGVDAVARLVASGVSYDEARLTLQNYFGKLTDAQKWGQPLLAQLGSREVQRELGTPAIGGKDSMSGTFIEKDKIRHDVPPTLVTFAVGKLDADTKLIPSHFQQTGSTLVHVRAPMTEAMTPEWNALRKNWQRVHELQQQGSILSSHAIRVGGVASCLTEMGVGNGIGVDLTERPDSAEWFTPEYGSFIAEVPAGIDPSNIFSGIQHAVIGKTSSDAVIRMDGSQSFTCDLKQAQEEWEKPLDSVFPRSPSVHYSDAPITRPTYDRRSTGKSKGSFAQPRVSVLTFPGTNCEYETQAAFNRAGAEANVVLFRNLTRSHIEESIVRMVREIKQSQIIAIPGGFSLGDQPDGSAKFIANVLRNERVRDAIMDHIKQNDGLMIGICNGFQALVKSSLLPHGSIDIQKAHDATLTHNDSGHFQSFLSNHTVTSVLSPWMKNFAIGDELHLPIAHGEGKLINVPSSVWEKGQVPFQYVGMDGKVRMSFPDNPNGSQDAIAGLTDPSGRIFGMMAHPERSLKGLNVNIGTGRRGQDIVNAGVDYFS